MILMKYIVLLISIASQLFCSVEESNLPLMDTIYSQEFKVVNRNQEAWVEYAAQNRCSKLRVMTFNMLYNVQAAEDKLPFKHRWLYRKPRLLEYLDYAKADIISSQELQTSQINELMTVLGPNYSYYGQETRVNEGRSDTNAIFYNAYRLELIDGKTIFYDDLRGNAFTYCCFRDKFQDKKFVVINTKLSWGITWSAMKKRLSEAKQLKEFVQSLATNEPILLMGDFNTLPFLDGKSIVEILTEHNLKDAKAQSIFRPFGPFCSITNSNILLTPFTGPELSGFILDRIFINEYVWVLTHAIDTAKVNGEYASDHFPVIADIFFK